MGFHIQSFGFNSVGWGQSPTVRVVRVFCGCNLVIGGPWDRVPATGVVQGAYIDDQGWTLNGADSTEMTI